MLVYSTTSEQKRALSMQNMNLQSEHVFKKNKNKKINDNKTNKKKKFGSIHVLLTCYAQISFEPIAADGPKAFPKMHRIT